MPLPFLKLRRVDKGSRGEVFVRFLCCLMASPADETKYERLKEDPSTSSDDLQVGLRKWFGLHGRDIGKLLKVLEDGDVGWNRQPKACLCLYIYMCLYITDLPFINCVSNIFVSYISCVSNIRWAECVMSFVYRQRP